jgi:hypothetical protein
VKLIKSAINHIEIVAKNELEELGKRLKKQNPDKSKI